MPKARVCYLTNKETGERIRFETAADASSFIGRKRGYIIAHLDRGYDDVWDIEQKTCYAVKILAPRNVSPYRNKPHKNVNYHSVCQTLCWQCGKAVGGGCNWSRNFTPVEGWTATPTVISCDSCVESFLVIHCPEFVYG